VDGVKVRKRLPETGSEFNVIDENSREAQPRRNAAMREGVVRRHVVVMPARRIGGWQGGARRPWPKSSSADVAKETTSEVNEGAAFYSLP